MTTQQLLKNISNFRFIYTCIIMLALSTTIQATTSNNKQPYIPCYIVVKDQYKGPNKQYIFFNNGSKKQCPITYFKIYVHEDCPINIAFFNFVELKTSLKNLFSFLAVAVKMRVLKI